MYHLERSFYDILELKPYSSLNEVKHAFKRLAVQYHPDKNPGNLLAEERFKEISNAYHILGDEDSKREYDLRLSGYRSFVRNKKEEDPEARRRKMRAEMLKRRKAAAEKKIVDDWTRLQNGTPVTLRRGFNYALIATGSILLFRNWFYTMETLSPFSYLAAIIFLLVGNILEQNLNYTIYLYKELKGKIRFSIPKRIIRNLLVGLIIGAGSGISGAHLMALYHFKYYSEETTGRVEVILNGGFTYQYRYEVDGKVYKKPLPRNMIPEPYHFNREVRVRYSRVNPVFAKVIEE